MTIPGEYATAVALIYSYLLPRALAAMRFHCPNCRTTVAKGSEHFPFCGNRCRMTDLGAWFSEEYRVSRPLTPLQRLEMDGFETEDSGNWDRLSSEEDV